MLNIALCFRINIMIMNRKKAQPVGYQGYHCHLVVLALLISPCMLVTCTILLYTTVVRPTTGLSYKRPIGSTLNLLQQV